LGHQFGARQDGSVGIDAVHGLAERQLLVVVGGMEEPSCGETRPSQHLYSVPSLH